MGLFSRFSFRKKLTTIILATAIAALLFTAITFSLLEILNFKRNLEHQTSLFTEIIATSTTPSLVMKVPHEADSLLATLVRDPHVTSVFLFDENGEPFAQYLRPFKDSRAGHDLFYPCDLLKEGNLPEQDIRCLSWDHLALFHNIYFDGEKIGSIYLQSDLELLYSQLSTSGLTLIALLMQATFIAFIVAYPLQRTVTRPVLHLAARIREVTQNDDFTVRAEKFSDDEIGILSDGFNEMLDHIEEQRNTLLKNQEELEKKVHERTLDLQAKNSELLRAKKEAESSSLAKSNFLANISHEIRTPMVGVLGIAELLQESELTQRQRHLVETIHKSGESLLDVFNDILDYSQLEAEKMRLVEGEFNLWDLLEDVMELFGEIASKKGIELVCDISPALPEALWGDAGRLRQVLVNLVGNAVKFTEKGEVRLFAEMEDEAGGDDISLKIVISDTGPGIDKMSHQSIFEAFTQTDESSSRQYGGSGLGLSIVRGIVDLMGGRIGLESELGHGAVFSVQVAMRLPVGSNDRAILRPLEGKTVLIGCLSSTLRTSISRQVEAAGALALYAEDEKELMRLLESLQEISLLLVDERLLEGLDDASDARRRFDDLSRRGRLVTLRRLEHAGGGDDERGRYLFMPLRPSQVREVLLLGPLEASGHPVVDEAMAASAQEMFRILVAEDNPETRKLMKLLLETQGYSVSLANNGYEVLDSLEKDPFDLILMDCHMPYLDGLETTRRLRSEGVDIPIIALTAHVSPEHSDKCYRAGMNDFLSKPFKKKRLLDLLGVWAERSGAASQTQREG